MFFDGKKINGKCVPFADILEQLLINYFGLIKHAALEPQKTDVYIYL